MRDLPPLRAVRAFEACYRLRSFTRAAAALNVKQPAISHQIRQLERDLGRKLFVKKGAAILPTEPAHAYYERVAAALSEIAAASRGLRLTPSRPVTLATYPGIASFWALPRLASAREDLGAFPVRVTTADRDADIPLTEVDAAILFGDGAWPGYDSLPLIDEAVIPVANPALAAAWAAATPAQLLTEAPLILLEDPERRWHDWEDWRRHFAPEVAGPVEGTRVTDHGIAIHQALQGFGITLGWRGIVADLLASGTLVALPYDDLTSPRGYHLVMPPPFRRSATGQGLIARLLPEPATETS